MSDTSGVLAGPIAALINPCDVPVIGGACPSNIVKSGWDAVVASFEAAVGQTVRLMFTFWETSRPPRLWAADGPVGALQRDLSWYVAAAAVVSVLVGSARLAWARQASAGGPLLGSLVRLLVVSAVGVPAVAALVAAGDGFAGWVLQRSAGGDFGARLALIGQVSSLTGALGGSASGALGLLIALLAILGALVQAVVLVLRGAVLVILTATLPLAASATNTDLGRQWWQRSTGWLVAFVVFKPAAALVYAGAFYLIGSGTDPQSVIAGLMTLALAACTLPALMKLVVPAVSAAGSSAGAGDAVALGGALATGAVGAAQLAGRGSGGGGSGSRGGSSNGGAGASGAARDVTEQGAGVAGPSGSTGSSGASGAPGSSGGAGSAGPSGGSAAPEPSGAAGGAKAGGAAGSGTAAGAGTAGAAVAAVGRAVQAGGEAGRKLGAATAGDESG